MIGLELNDTGLLAAGADGALLDLEPDVQTSPGTAVIEGDRLQVGMAAERRCRRVPRQTNRHFWSQLSSDPLREPAYAGWTCADLVHAHLSHIWRSLAPAHEEVLVAVPNTYAEHQLELLAGIMKALAIPVRGFVPLSLAALPKALPTEMLLHLDLTLHHTLLTVLDSRREPFILENVVISGLGLDRLRADWMQVIADTFVRRTRFDPFHAADTEQDLYDQLPQLLADLETAEDTAVEITTPSATHRIELPRDTIAQVLVPLMDAIRRQLDRLQEDRFDPQPGGTILVSHRAACLPGLGRLLEAATDKRVLPLERGAAAKGVLAFEQAAPPREEHRGVPFLNRRPRPGKSLEKSSTPPSDHRAAGRPAATHLLYRSRGYPVSERPLVIGREVPPGSTGIRVHGRTEGVSRRHCQVALREGRLMLTDTSTYGTFVDGIQVTGETALTVGQTIRVGTPGEELQVIACQENDETPLV
jgi:hypothetical protein